MGEKVAKKFNCIDLFKFLMAIVVIAIHTDPLIDSKNQILKNIVDIIYVSAVPFFFLASGFFLGNKIKKQDNIEYKTTIIKQYLKKL